MRRSVAWIGRRTASYGLSTRRFHQQTVQTALTNVRARLDAVGITGSDAKALVAHALEPTLESSNELFLWMDRQLRTAEAQRLEAMLQRRADGEPLAYVIGVKEFWSLTLHVTKDTLIPRADSECLIESLVTLYPKTAPLRILDLGTGSGALLLAALSEYPQATGVGIDISRGALNVSKTNAQRLGLDDRSEFLELDMELLPSIDTNTNALVEPEKVRQLLHGFDVILCNPPYIPRSEIPLVAPDVLAYEPHGALFSAGPDAVQIHPNPVDGTDEPADLGLRFYIALRDSVETLLDPNAPLAQTVLVEIGSERQALAVRELFATVPSLACDSFLMDGSDRHRGVVFRTRHSI